MARMRRLRRSPQAVRTQGDAELMAKEQVLRFKPTRRQRATSISSN
jgi:hypothetical protein